MKLNDSLRWILAPCLLVGGAALLIADSVEPLPECDDVAPMQRSYEAQLTCENPGEWIRVFEGHLSFDLTNPRDVRGTDFDREGTVAFGFEEYTFALDQETSSDIEGLAFLRVNEAGSWSATCPDNEGTATINTLEFLLEVDLQLEEGSEGNEDGEDGEDGEELGGEEIEPTTHQLRCYVSTEEAQQDVTCTFLTYTQANSCDLSLLAQRNDL